MAPTDETQRDKERELLAAIKRVTATTRSTSRSEGSSDSLKETLTALTDEYFREVRLNVLANSTKES